ncbi:MAG: hypothetical protein A2541_02210 [Candidatus Taylorbacteria bacterium RIFOXYD2_FULL_36_9]|uniref:Uncharacterized protein n=1 Tax=Candidatus Taylorbacteria bacterium RIFOXYD2_FULL_36_9 TaxID=1802338 RepID=A0A1G2PIU7_9BACT|nr:MAG: hypothetical protein A2541_02210 [Candidatus Taylorbacteria bacterium RIFOXYD2_FULL_36_9]
MKDPKKIKIDFLKEVHALIEEIKKDSSSILKIYDKLFKKYVRYEDKIEEIRFLYDLDHYIIKGSISKEDLINEFEKIFFNR